MEYIIFGIIALAIWHWWYETILAPSLRLEFRFRLFKLRDEARELKMHLGSNFDDRHFHYLQDSINNAITLLPRMDVAMLVTVAKRMEHDAELRARIAARSKILDDCKFPEAADIRKRANEVLGFVVGANSGGWIPYLIPIALAVACYKQAEATVKSITALSEADLQSIAPSSASPAVPA
jgi:hypothetical protein